ncbi:MAG: prepilin-type N-terminal cleavage/methylation domain-containing protein [Desulfatitalea sp.]
MGIVSAVCSGRQGLTLVEVMIALLLFSVGILAVAAMQSVGMAAFASAQRGSANSLQAGDRIEEILSKPYEDPILVDADNGYDPTAPDHGPVALSSGRGTIEWEVDDDFPVPGSKRITVTVRTPAHGLGGGVFAYDYVKARDLR